MIDAVTLIKKLDFLTRTSVRHIKEARLNAVAAENVITRLKSEDVLGQLASYELAALVESLTIVSKVIAGFDEALR